ncbi:hypothetical protein HMPREF9446_02661 [Bacteroides fluxus YIT 12057]|uniref:Uncharacterized protein n=1 Tax=Bacteroides fluxus YIT 12057 TaxID=763034 RepID=F3PV86_9BACE|nr:hypothetical protein HMPREF9446_02661 [Bacteroides fluxus YIT 12057]
MARRSFIFLLFKAYLSIEKQQEGILVFNNVLFILNIILILDK